jgi:hypothetical protein
MDETARVSDFAGNDLQVSTPLGVAQLGHLAHTDDTAQSDRFVR